MGYWVLHHSITPAHPSLAIVRYSARFASATDTLRNRRLTAVCLARERAFQPLLAKKRSRALMNDHSRRIRWLSRSGLISPPHPPSPLKARLQSAAKKAASKSRFSSLWFRSEPSPSLSERFEKLRSNVFGG